MQLKVDTNRWSKDERSSSHDRALFIHAHVRTQHIYMYVIIHIYRAYYIFNSYFHYTLHNIMIHESWLRATIVCRGNTLFIGLLFLCASFVVWGARSTTVFECWLVGILITFSASMRTATCIFDNVLDN
jgi:hypothetical protein